jgi:putative membrane protein
MWTAFALGIAGCGGAMSAGEMAEQRGPFDDGEIAAILAVATRGELQQSELAQERSQNENVREFAEQMLGEHGMAGDRHRQLSTQRGIHARETAVSRQLRQETDAMMRELVSLQGEEFDLKYMDAQVDQHRALIAMLNDSLIPSARDAEYRTFLTQLRDRVERHLDDAREVRGEVFANRDVVLQDRLATGRATP